MAGISVSIMGFSNAGKTTMVKGLEDTLVVAADGKPFLFEQPFCVLDEYKGPKHFQEFLNEKIKGHTESLGKPPKRIVIDTITNIYDAIAAKAENDYDNYDIHTELNKGNTNMLKVIDKLLQSDNNYTVILISHSKVAKRDKKDVLVESVQGRFASKGGFLSKVEESIFIEAVGETRYVWVKNHPLARTHLDYDKDMYDSKEFSFQKHIESIEAMKVGNASFCI